jgi:hypothetical protein
MNRLIEHLKKEDALTLEALRGLYRTLALKCHPDVTKKSGNDFVQLQVEYEDALRQLLFVEHDYPKKLADVWRSSEDPRSAFLRTLYLYSIVYNRRHWKDIFSVLLASAKAYDHSAEELLDKYRRAFIDKPNEWKKDGFTAETHERLLLAIKQLGSYYENDVYPNKRLLLSYINELSEKAKRLGTETSACITSFCRFLRHEAEGPRVELMMIWDRRK